MTFGVVLSKLFLKLNRLSCLFFDSCISQVRKRVLESRETIFSLIGRGVEILWKLGLYWASLTYDKLVGRGPEVVPVRAGQLRYLLCDLGPSFIKAGQVT